MRFRPKPKITEQAKQASRARARAERALAERKAETPRVMALTESWRRIREENHFAQAITHSLRGGNP